MDTRQCKRCYGEFHEVFFRSFNKVTQGVKTPYNRGICIGCEQTAKDERKQLNRPLQKARDAIRTHRVKMVARGDIDDIEDLVNVYGWEPHQMAHDIEHAFKNGCPYCHRPFSEMGHGLSNVTLDIVDPEKLPYYTTNTYWVCDTCNKGKQRTPPGLFAAKCECWRQWDERQESMKHDPYLGLPLLEGRCVQTGPQRQLAF